MRLGFAWVLAAVAASLAAAAGCKGHGEARAQPAATSTASATAAPSGSTTFAAELVDAGARADAGAEAGADADPMALHVETKEDLLALFTIKRHKRDARLFLEKTFDVGTPAHANQGNKELAKHFVSKQKCLAGLAGLTLQAPEQKRICGGMENMVPIYRHGDPKRARTCIDVFEFPNKPCELPFVWIAPVQAERMCELQGKRLCQQEEWTLACRGDPEGGKDRLYAYGDELDLDICNTNKPAAKYGAGCDPDSARTAWKTCATNTEPAGAFPGCRSRFGVFDQHGNVAEIMTRRDPEDGVLYDQLKGSAFFYVDVARKPNERPDGGRETYPDHCAYDPRWHVEPMESAWHVNYHLGFRCCKTVHK
ncbi:MAG TPA: SUMF1/EgtB/PvdO family nonheme iron enzyme [Minicystis sp.]|nr:SUMF1/EgtB/PvdO family nonheme iron enzyme [Minicystis sp.]